MILVALLYIGASKSNENIVDKYIQQLKENNTDSREKQAILWSLAELSRQIDKSMTSDEVETEIGAKINEILERVELADTILRKDFNSMRMEFEITKQEVNALIESAKRQILEDMELYKEQLIESLNNLMEISEDAQAGYIDSSKKKVTKVFGSLKSKALIRTSVFFVCFQVLLLFGIVFYKKLDNQLRMFL